VARCSPALNTSDSKKTEECFVLVVADVDGAAFQGYAFLPDVEAGEDGVSLYASMFPFVYTIGGIKMYLFGLAWYLVLHEEMQQDAVHATAWIGSDSQAVERDFDARSP